MSAEVVICTDCQASDCLAAQTARGWRRTDDGYCTFTSLIVHFTAIPHECCMDIQSKHSILPLTQVDSGPTVDKPHISTQSRKVQPKSLTIYHRTLGGQEWDSIRDLSVHFWNKYSEKATHTSTYNYSIKIILFLVINQCVYHSICFLSNSYYLHIIFPCWTLKVKNKENAERALTDRKLYRTELGTSTTKAKERAGWGRTTVRWKCNAIPATHPIQRKRLASRPSRCSTRITHQKAKSAAWLDTHTHTYTCWSKWRGSWWSKSRQGWRNLQVTCWFKWTVLHEQVVSVLKDLTSRFTAGELTSHVNAVKLKSHHCRSNPSRVTTDEVSRVSQITPLVDPSTFKSRPLLTHHVICWPIKSRHGCLTSHVPTTEQGVA